MSATKTAYTVTLSDGRTITRKSARAYTHAVVTDQTIDGVHRGEGVWSFCGSLELAVKRQAAAINQLGLNGTSQKFAGTTFRIVEVAA